MVSSKVLEAVDLYQSDPVRAALEEEEDLPKLSAMLQELESVLEGKMELGEREREKRLEEVEDIIENGKVKKLREDCHQAESKIDNLKRERKESPLLEKKETCPGQILRRYLSRILPYRKLRFPPLSRLLFFSLLLSF
ncbi:hypothetical protein AKJ64_04690 [candidate division MSBL1 archaeon SCGC-AAA259E17]|uniref:Uncharacterized protein n=1 Tax=candidate division MSBL1 archaeon SCGC-AAA259E17 TaxID=1698263 RepID=A0A133UBH6_9EURY|nr:hypothetical protein AKJ64_04690 [candidate division MSBL1 archaeon SCGC-AAA259E17]